MAPSANSRWPCNLSYFLFYTNALGGVALPVLSRSMDKNKDKVRLFAETALRFTLLVGIVLIFMGTSFGPG
jgi:O-antigen/teichoic acid export membrane protein